MITRATNGDRTRTTAITLPVASTDLIAALQAFAKTFERRSGHVDPTERPQSCLFPSDHLRKSAVDVHSDHASHCPLLLSRKGAWGETTPTDPRSQRKRASRRGGQLLTRALGSSNR